MGKRRSAASSSPAPATPRFYQMDLRDWLVWMDAARELAVAAGLEHRRNFTITSASLTWHALAERMRAAGLDEMGHDDWLFRAAKTLYLQVESETAYGSRLALDVWSA